MRVSHQVFIPSGCRDLRGHLNSNVLPETRERLLTIVDQMKEQAGIEGLILGGTELSLILRDEHARGIPVLDTTRIHVKAIVEELLS